MSTEADSAGRAAQPAHEHSAASPAIAYRVLASGSSGNCSVVRLAGAATFLIDLGLGPRRMQQELARAEIDLDAIDAVLLTHLDGDHCRPLWTARLPQRVRVVVHAAHAKQARALGWSASRVEACCDGRVEIDRGIAAGVQRAAHDDSGVAVYRLECNGASLGHATDIGAPTPALARFLTGVDALGVESNYCPRLQLASPRPAFLKERIMGGAGHLSNEQSAKLVAAVKPRKQVVLLHLSRQCNDPEAALAAHAGHGRSVALSWQHKSTPWFAVGSAGPVAARAGVNGSLASAGSDQLAPGYGTGRRRQPG